MTLVRNRARSGSSPSATPFSAARCSRTDLSCGLPRSTPAGTGPFAPGGVLVVRWPNA
ncbi:hypothetical protein ACU635_33200 [[Actinomadura] parvosata]|uniref:hypothetical protein n=1 Tax=[Actinomadura] parvosata TaxID=1955412 RepID=UPI00406C16AE